MKPKCVAYQCRLPPTRLIQFSFIDGIHMYCEKHAKVLREDYERTKCIVFIPREE